MMAKTTEDGTMSEIRILTPAFLTDDQEVLASFRGMDASRLKEKTFRLGLLDNTKPNAGLLLEKIGKELSETGLVKNIVSLVKESSNLNPSGSAALPELLDRLAEETDFVITGLGN
jgi:hypothetical protein